MPRLLFRIMTLLAVIVLTAGQPGLDGHNSEITLSPAFDRADESAVLPLDAQTTISGEIGQSEAAYHFIPSEAGYTTRSSADRSRVVLSPAAAVLYANGLAWDLRLRAWGYAGAQTLTGALEPLVTQNQGEYRYPGLTEWYRNGPFGLQQGFTVAQPPADGQGSQLNLALGLGELRAQVDRERTGVTLSGANGAAKIAYVGLKAYDAAHRSLPAWLEADAGAQTLWLRVETAGARYPITVDPLARQVRLTASQAPDENFGISVALSGDGSTALVGAFNAGVDGTLSQGAAYAFHLDKIYGIGGAPTVFEWVYEARFEAGTAGDRFGIAVALSDDGNVALVGADQSNWGGHIDQGAAYIFTRASHTWTRRATLAAADAAADDGFGWALALNAAGDTALIGAYGAEMVSGETTYTNNGAAYVFTGSGASWSQQAKLQHNAGSNGRLGYAVALGNGGDTALIGAYAYDSGIRVDQGVVMAYHRSAGVWSLEDMFAPLISMTGGLFGRALALDVSGATALIGAPGTQVGSITEQGAAYIFTRAADGNWIQQAVLSADDGATGDGFGTSVALRGYNAYVGAHKADVNGRVDQGAVYAFTRSGAATNWPRSRKFTASDGAANDQFGVSVASGGTTLLIGARWANPNGNSNQGAAYVYFPDPSGDETSAKLTGCGGNNDYFGRAVALSDDGRIALIGAPGADVGESIQQGVAFIFTRSGSTWTQSARLSAADGGLADFFGNAVALSGDGNIALIGAPYHDGTVNNQGAAYMFTHTGGGWSQANWSQLRKITYAEAQSEDYFGDAVALSDDGKTVLIGAPNASRGKTHNGMIVFYDYNPAPAAPVEFFGQGDNDRLGDAVALSGDATTALAGAPGTTLAGHVGQGLVRVYAFDGHDWVYRVSLAPSGVSNDAFGAQVALSDDGNTALIGAPGKNVSGNTDQGAAYIYTRSDAGWSAGPFLTAANGAAQDAFGSSVALNSGGTIALVGASDVSGEAGHCAGAVYAFVRQGATWIESRSLYGLDHDDDSYYATSVALSDNGWTGISGARGGGGYGQGAAYIISNPAGLRAYLPFAKK